MRKIILASASPRRRELLANAGVIFQVCPGNSEEKITKKIPEDIVKELSLQKAMATALKFDMEEGTVILGADTIVSFDNKILGKPKNEEDAVNTLSMLQGNTHQVYTGVTVMERKDSKWETITFAESYRCFFLSGFRGRNQGICSNGRTDGQGRKLRYPGRIWCLCKGNPRGLYKCSRPSCGQTVLRNEETWNRITRIRS